MLAVLIVRSALLVGGLIVFASLHMGDCREASEADYIRRLEEDIRRGAR